MNSARNETHHFWLLFYVFLQPDVYIPHPPIPMQSLEKQNLFFAQMIHHFVLFLQKSNDFLKCL